MKWRIAAVLAVLAIGWYFFGPARVKHHPPGVLVTREPQLTLIEQGKPWNAHGYLITPLAQYSIRALVLGRARYWSGRETDLSRYDLAVGWGIMSDARVLDKLRIWQDDRWYHYEWSGDPPAIPSEIAARSKNMHIIPANDQVSATLDRVVTGDVITLEGELIEARSTDGWKWRSSLNDDDSGPHSCKVCWVEKLSIEP